MRCRVGDQAVVVRARLAVNIGKLVEIERPTEGRPGVWDCVSLGSPFSGFDVTTRRPSRSMRCRFKDTALRPLRPDDRLIRETMETVWSDL